MTHLKHRQEVSYQLMLLAMSEKENLVQVLPGEEACPSSLYSLHRKQVYFVKAEIRTTLALCSRMNSDPGWVIVGERSRRNSW